MVNELNVLPAGDESGSPLGNKDNSEYVKQLVQTLWQYRQERFAGAGELFDRSRPTTLRPPVFRKNRADANVIVKENAPREVNAAVLGAIPATSRHRWFASMKSSQALAQSVFGNLASYGKAAALAGLPSEDGEAAFFENASPSTSLGLEAAIHHLGEPSSTSVDVMIDGGERVAVECKLTEWEVGSCSRPLTEDDDPRYCDGSYRIQNSRSERCQLTSIGVSYWRYVPMLFNWDANVDHQPCPLRFTFQLVRNVLAACITPGGAVRPDAHAVMVYDARNPAFTEGGAGLRSWLDVRTGLKEPSRIRRASWQRVVARLAEDPELDWLVSELRRKYGFA